MNDRCVVSFAKGYNFLRGLKRLEEKCKLLNIDFFGFTEYPTGCPDHQASPFAFKFFCIDEIRKKGYKKILWLDTSVIIKNNLDDIFNFIERDGYFFIQNWHTVGDYCHDKALKTLGITREQSFKVACMQGTNFGLNFNHDSSLKFLNEIIRLSLDGITFPGPYTNTNNIASKDNRVLGHRHDQIAMSIISLRLGMNKWFSCGESPWFIHDRDFVKDVNSTVVDINMSE